MRKYVSKHMSLGLDLHCIETDFPSIVVNIMLKHFYTYTICAIRHNYKFHEFETFAASGNLLANMLSNISTSNKSSRLFAKVLHIFFVYLNHSSQLFLCIFYFLEWHCFSSVIFEYLLICRHLHFARILFENPALRTETRFSRVSCYGVQLVHVFGCGCQSGRRLPRKCQRLGGRMRKAPKLEEFPSAPAATRAELDKDS